MPYVPKTSPVIRATRTAMNAINGLRDARREAAQDDAERARADRAPRGAVRARTDPLRGAIRATLPAPDLPSPDTAR